MKTPAYTFTILLFVLLTSLTSCFAPRPIVQMEVEESENIKWNYGRQVVRLKSDSLEAEIFFDTYTKKHLVFDVEVTNWSSREVLVSPEEIYLQRDSDGSPIPALDPEVEIFGKKVEASRREANSKNLAVAVGVAAVATVVAVAATSDGDNTNNNNDNGNNFTSITYIGTDVAPPAPAVYLPPDIAFWEDVSLRKTTLAKGFKVGGKVVFPRLDQYQSFSISIPVDGRVLTAHFRQKVFQP
jgi:hypothetical protein